MNISESVLFVKRVILGKRKKRHFSRFRQIGVLFKFSFFFLMLLLTTSSINPESIILHPVRYLLPGKKEYSEPSEIRIEKGKIVSIKKINSFSGNISYVLPGFCDANVTLSTDSLGGQKDRAGIFLSLRSFFAHGFTGILSVGDPAWVETLLKDAQRLKTVAPWVKKSGAPWIAKSSETKKLGNLPGYNVISSSQEAISNMKKKPTSPVHLFYRYQEGESFVFDGPFLYQLKKTADAEKIKLALSAFGDEFSILEGINAGIPILYHPIPEGIAERTSPGMFRNLIWGPMFSVYYYQKIAGTPEWETDLTVMKEWSPYFAKNIAPEPEFAGKLTHIQEEDRKDAEQEYNSYLAFLRRQKNLSQGMLLSSGTGYLHVHPGIGGWKEMEILASALGNEETIRIATESTCSFIEAPHEGKIREDKPAFINIFAEDPLVDLKNLKSLRKIIAGEISYPPEKREPASSQKKRGKNERIRKRTL
ncbi:hypothetical protein [Leptospira borgpetersenii]|uniref:hypothetical protein n=1 Tax=Leptospira borgpetersenii TaxID=174 RepID=UPI001880BFC7|nr:hypothetical protein [Leptospira borgpetersenii]MBE8363887.1 hypothetical protein [Leptospira borgpetersenii serovar Balcanica]MBE8369044.1 hypothetical protein [Leptospira borgpetersenii serovar Balcanica]MBE8422949.1 hypothetical protein [Leptospira borgpetersenii serovar Balcanica]MBF3350024.1 hypothetical protein [Leptospira borgpetersenii serovar Balcanica]